MEQIIIKKLLLIAGCGIALAGTNLVGLSVCAQLKADLVRTYVAKRDIAPRSKITEEDIVEVDVPRDFLLHACTDKKDIVGKYTEIQGMIPAGSPFYASMLYRGETLPDHPEMELCKGQTVFAMETDLTGAGSLSSGQRVDVHLTIDRMNGSVLSGPIIEHARIIRIQDHKGLDIQDEKSTGVPYMLSIAVKKEDIDMLNMAEKKGELRVFPSVESYETGVEGQRVEGSDVLNYLKTLQNIGEGNESA